MPLSRRKFLKVSIGTTLAAGVAGAGGLVYARDIEPGMIEITQVDATLPHLSPAFEGYRLAQISDIHMGTGMTEERLAQIVSMVNAQQPDLVAITGDYVTMGFIRRVFDMLVEPLQGLSAPDGVISVRGNHDYLVKSNALRQVWDDSHILDISNDVHTLTRGEARLHFAGVDTLWYHQDRLNDVLAKLPGDGAAILLAHEPDFADISAPTGRFDLQISGHTHGGQVIIPFVGPPIIPRYGQKYPLGRYQVGGMIQYTNRGVGTVWPPVRFNCPPEITIFTLHAGADSA